MAAAAPAVLLLMVVALLVGIGWGIVQKQWILAAGCAALLTAGVAWVVLLLKNVEWTYLYAGTQRSLVETAGELRTYHDKNGSYPPGLKVADLGNTRLPAPGDG